MLSTKDITVGGGSGKVSPLIKPGTHKVKIYDLYAETPPYTDTTNPDRLIISISVPSLKTFNRFCFNTDVYI